MMMVMMTMMMIMMIMMTMTIMIKMQVCSYDDHDYHVDDDDHNDDDDDDHRHHNSWKGQNKSATIWGRNKRADGEIIVPGERQPASDDPDKPQLCK